MNIIYVCSTASSNLRIAFTPLCVANNNKNEYWIVIKHYYIVLTLMFYCSLFWHFGVQHRQFFFSTILIEGVRISRIFLFLVVRESAIIKKTIANYLLILDDNFLMDFQFARTILGNCWWCVVFFLFLVYV